MPRMAVVFDTNIYRQLSRADLTELVREQSECSVLACANFWTIMELGAHLADPTDPDLRRCHEALQAVWAHCTQYDGSSAQLRVTADSDSQLALSLFNRALPGRAEETNRYAFLLESLVNSPTGVVPAAVQPIVDHLRLHRDEVEATFAQDMMKVVRGIDPSAKGWQPFAYDSGKRNAELRAVRAGSTLPVLATAMVVRASAATGITLEDEKEIVGRARYILDHFATPLHFYNACLCKTIESGIDYTVGKHANSIWDFHLCFYGLPDASTNGMPLALVSNERTIKAAAIQAGAADRVMTLDEFRDRLRTRHF